MHERESLGQSQEQLESVFRRIFELCGVNVGPLIKEPVLTSPFEPLNDTPPEFWIDSVALHMVNISSMCVDIQLDLNTLSSTADGVTPWPSEIGSSLWAAIGDIRFHASCFPLYAEKIREMISDNTSTSNWCLRPSLGKLSSSSVLNLGKIENELAKRMSLTNSEASILAHDLEDLYDSCMTAESSIEKFASTIEADLSVLAERFASVQLAILQLGAILLRADVTSALLMHHLDTDGQC